VIAPLILVFSSVTFGLYWVVFRYNLLYVTVSRPNTRGLLYPTALNQLFTGVYVMELCMIGLFFLVRDEHGRSTCVGQAVVMIIATGMTITFQVLLNDAFAPLLHSLPPTGTGGEEVEGGGGETEEKEPKYNGSKTNYLLRMLLRKCWNWGAVPNENLTFVDALFSDMHDGMECAASNEPDDLVPLEFQYEVIRIQKPVVWIPNDRLRISEDEIFRFRQYGSDMGISNEHASLDAKGRVAITRSPYHFSELESMKL